MLVLTRKAGEAILIGDEVIVRVLGRKGNSGNDVRLGIEAHDDVVILREELKEREVHGPGTAEHFDNE